MALRDQLRVLVVDDMSTSRGLITQALEGLDYNMPGMDGLALLENLRGAARTAGIGFLLITGRADAAVIERGRALKMNNYIKKPFQPADLKAAIEAIVGRL